MRPIGTYLPRTPADLTEWLNDLPSLAVPDMLVPASSVAAMKAQDQEGRYRARQECRGD